MKNIRHLINNNILLKIFSGIIAYGTWNILQHTLHTERSYTIPICCYNVPDTTCFIATPHTIDITLKGPQTALNKIDKNALAIHFDAQKMRLENQQWTSSSEGTIFLPNETAVIHYNPMLISTSFKPI